MKLGILSDTHDRLPASVLAHFEGVDRILHAGDIGSHHVLASLEAVAPVTAVWGNTDGFGLRHLLPEVATIECDSKRFVIVHGHRHGVPTPALLREAHPDADVVVYGHTHKAAEDWIDGALLLNPGSAGAPRGGRVATIAILHVMDVRMTVRWIEIADEER
ncbi:MAG: metallophosphoesterase family protein [Longimicrobiales bacterium]